MEGLAMLMFFLLSINFTSSDLDNVDCSPTQCGGMNITYPFYVAVAGHSSFCSVDPGFLEVSCQKNLPLVNLSGDTYIIKNISYTNQTLWVVNSAFSPSTNLCISSTLTSVHNLTLNSNILKFTSKPKEIVLLQHCSVEGLQGMSNRTTTICKSSSYKNISNSLVGVYVEDFKGKKLAGECRWAVSVPYIASGASEMVDKIREGFPLKWTTSTKSSGSQMILAGSVIGVIISGALWLCCICCIGSCMSMTTSTIKCAKEIGRIGNGNRNVEYFIRSQESLAPKRYTYKDIKNMTMSFKLKLGEGGFSVVYKGMLYYGPYWRLVAVKMLKKTNGDGQDFINEVASISRTNHVNVVTLLGFCFEGRKRGLVYEFMPNGSLEKFTRVVSNNNHLLSWETLFQIALGIARGLEYLHKGCNTRILHLDIKPHNILLGESFCPKISDFGLAELCPQTQQSNASMTAARGTIGYIAPEVVNRRFGDVSHKSDVYSYGMMVLEVIGCRDSANANVDTSSTQYFPDWIYRQLNRVEEPEGDGIINDEEKVLQRKLILVSLWCIQTIPSRRPSMSGVLQMLEGSLESIEVPPVPVFSSPPRPQSDPSGSSTMTYDSSSEFMGSGQNQELQEIPFSFPPGFPACYRDPIPVAGFSLPALVSRIEQHRNY